MYLDFIISTIVKCMKPIGIFYTLVKGIWYKSLFVVYYTITDHYGFRGISYDWFNNYLLIENDFVQFRYISPTESLICGVPQGPILVPLLFILYYEWYFLILIRWIG